MIRKKTKKDTSIHFSDMQRVLDTAYQHRQTVDVKAFVKDGTIVRYRGWYVHHQHWRGGTVTFRSPVSGELRTCPEIFIIEINGLKVYL